ncbi:MAG: SDR family oxidoreductase [Beijerinckiaceae bacterium]|nr:SDR family oxidoreductase [Beijerinckiaceae bacterium]
MSVTPHDVTLITGASVGIGADLARVFARHGHELALVARDGARMEALADEIVAGGGRRPLIVQADLSAPGAADALVAEMDRLGGRVTNLVNNAGFGLIGRVAELDRTDQMRMIDLNLRALTDLTLAFLPAIRTSRGGLMNVASTAAFYAGPGMAVYYATKAFVLSFSQGLAHELKEEGVRVTALCPGPTKTEFFERAGVGGSPFGPMPMASSMSVAQAGYAGFMRGKMVVVPGLFNKLLTVTSGLQPRALSMRTIARMQMGRAKGAVSKGDMT